MITGVKVLLASGKIVIQKRIIPNVPTLSSTPRRRTEVPGVPAFAASGSHVWSGQSGALIAKAIKNPKKRRFCVVELMTV
jgi:hypothetical protein